MSRSNQPLRQSSTESDVDGHSSMNRDVLEAEREYRPENFLDDDSASSRVEEYQGFSGETVRSHEKTGAGAAGLHAYPQHLKDARNKAFRSVRRPLGHDVSHDAGNRKQPMRATLRRHILRRNIDHGDKNEGEEIGVHMWENNGKLKLETPWFKSKVEA